MVGDRLPDLFRKPFHAGVDPAHRALQLGQLAHHAGREVGLRQPGGLPGERCRVGRAEHVGRDPAGQLLDPERLGAVAPEAPVEEHRVEARQERLERRAAILVPEEARVAEARHERALEVARDDPRIDGLGVDHGQERRQQTAVVVHHREEVLVVDHGRREHVLGELEELGPERAGDHRGILDQVGDFLQEARLAGRRSADAPAEAARVRVELPGDLRVARLAFDHHEILEELRAILVEAPHLDGPSGAAARRQEAMAVGDRARSHVLDDGALGGLEPADDKRHDAPAVQEQDPADGPAEQQLAAPVVELGVPVHLPGKREVAQHAREHVRQHVDRGFAPDAPAERQVDALGGLDALEALRVDAVLAREPGGGGRGLAVGLERGGGGRPHEQLFEVGLALGDAGDAHRQAPRRAVGLDGRLDLEAQVLHPRGGRLANLGRQRGQPAGGNLLAAEFDEQLAIHRPLTPPPARPAGTIAPRTPRSVWRWPRRAGARAGCTPCAR